MITVQHLQQTESQSWLVQGLLCTYAKKVVSNSSGLADFAIRLVNSVFNLPDGQLMFFEEFE